MALGTLALLGSCVKEVNDVGGKYNAVQEVLQICIGYLFSFFVFFFALIWLQFRLEKYFLTKDEIKDRNRAHMRFATRRMKRSLGSLYPLFSVFTKKDDKE